MPASESLWTCPDCGRSFVNRNSYHSCGHFEIEDHFQGKSENVRRIFDRYVETAASFGPLAVYAQKTRIVLQARTRFATAVPRQRWLTGHFWLRRRAKHPRVYRHEMHVYRDYGHIFRLESPEHIDDDFAKLLQEAYALGS